MIAKQISVLSLLTSYLVALRKMIAGHHCLGVMTLTSQLQKLALIIYVSKKSILSHLCLLVLLLCRLLPYARTSVQVLAVQVEINLEKELVEDKTFSFSRNPKLCMLKMTMLLKKSERFIGGTLLLPAQQRVSSAVFPEQEMSHHLSSCFSESLSCCSCLGKVLELETLVSSPNYLKKEGFILF